jgi:hypothetical protein
MRGPTAILALAAGLVAADAAWAQRIEVIGDAQGSRARVELPAGRPRGSIVLVAGGNGQTAIDAAGAIGGLRGNQIVRTQSRYRAAGWAAVVVDAGTSLSTLTTELRRRYGPRVVWVGTSRGTLRIARELPGASARPDRVVLTAGFYDAQGGRESVQASLGAASSLPPTLVIHHRRDGCRGTSPGGVAQLQAWAGNRVTVTWFDGGVDRGDPCQAAGHHGFAGLDGQVVAAVTRFAGR